MKLFIFSAWQPVA